MPDNLNSIALNQYSARFTTTVLNEVYRSQDVVTGAGLLKLTPVRQVNLGILNRLFEEWKNNAEAFRSPYFDFSNEEVKSALEEFMNTASQHIAVKRADLEPLLSDSVKESLKLLLTPANYFEDKIRAVPDAEFTHAKAEQLVKYTHIHRGIAEALLGRLTDSGSDSVYQTQAVSWLYEFKDNADLIDDTEQHLIQFAEIFPINISELLIRETGKSTTSPQAQPHKHESFFDSAFSQLEPSTARPVAPRAEPASAVIGEIVAKSNAGSSPERDSLNNRFKVEIPKPSEDKSYGTVPLKVENIAGSIPLGQRFMFVNQLFDRNSEHFDKAIYELDRVKSFEEAENLIWHRYASKYAWDVNGEAVTALLAIVKRKFA
ncbi:hypothetical protein J2Y45_000626 [Dyadobacter sp. BE34]|uniref:Uncharacterized protein n=1 Tax=Dyadobacter fermentans TaxID=94254 RepID=A0ABU1QQE8_9BACT|nr:MULTISPECIES: hypothetical protein [Dyadobacter]MDR6803356.1 hypothetical protein [Dyadobacter fermentans]MDR7041097.1 hypothetical protein [Dyadobacter sp. BE242]MDR7195500.1 hypothetical protein [Dyadobacter sp. BE34]MDR7213955.1 hypothetical protein [Dyadobacter sp. BE31]MDR7260907.1 hypothetical protein [Dyadobacter sp. BE32]